MWQIVAFNRTGTRPALNQAVGYIRVAHIVLRGPLGPLSPTAASGWTILKMTIQSYKMAAGSPCRVFSKTSLFLKTRSVIVTLVAVLAPAVPTTALYAILNECRLLGLLNPSTNISRRLAISLRPSARLKLSKTAPLHWFSKNETWIYNCQFSDNLPTVNSIFQTPQRKQTKVLQLLRNRLDLTCILCSVMNTVADSETAWFWQCFA